MQFEIIVTVDGKRYQMQVKRIYEGDTIERFEVTAGGKSVVFQTDYHYLKKNKKRKSADWKIISGDVTNRVAFALAVHEIEQEFKKQEQLKPKI